MSCDIEAREASQRACDDCELVGYVAGFARTVAKRIVDEGCTGWASGKQDVMRGAEHERRQAVGFEVAGDQTHGLVADWSHRDQEQCVDALLRAGFA